MTEDTPDGDSPPDDAETTRTQRTQAQRTAATRAKVLDATVEALVDVGYAGTTTQEVNRRAGVSRGALLHHFPTRESLVVAAVGHLVDRRMSELLTRPRTGDEDIDILLEAFAGPLFDAALELWVAARTDPALRAAMIPLEQKVSDAITTGSAELFGDRYTPDQIELSVELVRGLAVSRILRTADGDRALTRRLLPIWKEMIAGHGK
ncbi:TetR/AcrR family transcriptional regulator [Gordonia soli]|uniref:Putative TetR family transcriptional regulator n=1 Tax=Gordonia soli NBRC 108243 TaxID=1223545 RepID=M0QIS7_9ACTN|nr:TetR/AcrR family transcriptional regulator [Gordonia soli]GAC68344.1 putative TetR family transcriptional regulator [Gordonia soli NBRC 108243]